MKNEAHVFKKKLKKNRHRNNMSDAELRDLFNNYLLNKFQPTEASKERDLKLFRLACEIREEERKKQLACVKWLIEARENAEAICLKCIYNTAPACKEYDEQGTEACIKGIIEFFNNH